MARTKFQNVGVLAEHIRDEHGIGIYSTIALAQWGAGVMECPVCTGQEER